MCSMVRTFPTSPHRYLAVPIKFSLAEGARSAVTVLSQSASTVLSVERMNSALTMLYQSVVGPIGSRERVLVAQFMMGVLPRGAGVAVRRQSMRRLVGLMAPRSPASPPNPRCSITWKVWSSLSIHHGNMAFAFIRWNPISKAARTSM